MIKLENGFISEHSVVYVEVNGVSYEYEGSEKDPIKAAKELVAIYEKMAKDLKLALVKEKIDYLFDNQR